MSSGPSSPPVVPDDQLVYRLLSLPESYTFDCKRIIGRVDKLLETVVAFANADGGLVVLGFEDPSKATGRDRVYGLQENLLNWDELLRKLKSRITEPEQLPHTCQQISCTLRDGTIGSVGLLRIRKSTRIHSIVDDGTYVRLQQGNKEITATEINDLSFARGTISAESQLTDVDFDLLKTDFWKSYADQRGLTRPLDQALHTIGLAKKNSKGELCPTMAAVLLFAEEPSGVLASKTAIRIFHYRGQRASTDPNTNLAKSPITVGGPLIQQIRDAVQAVIRELGQRVQFTEFGFEIVQKYPIRVINEAITNAVVHRDYRLPADILIRIFSDRIEVESPGLLVGPVTAGNIDRVGLEEKKGLFESDIEISDDVYILKAEDAQKLREPPRLAQVLVRPEHVTVKINEQAAFACSGLDQYGQPFPVSDVVWSASGGTVDSKGIFTAGDRGGAFTVKVVANGIEGMAEVRNVSKDEPTPTPPGMNYFRWRGAVPPQKWMNFYTKVLSKFATSPELKIEVSFEVKIEREQANAKSLETKSGLRELGLDDDVELT